MPFSLISRFFPTSGALFLAVFLILVGCKGDDCEEAPCDCDYKDRIECDESSCCEWGWKTSNNNSYSGGITVYHTTIRENCNCKEDDSKYKPLIEKTITLTADTSSAVSIGGISDGGSELSLIFRKEVDYGNGQGAFLMSSANRHMEGLKDIGNVSVFFQLVHLGITDKTSKAIHNLSVGRNPQDMIIALESNHTYLFQTTSGLKGLIRLEEISDKPGSVTSNTSVRLHIKYYQTGETFTAEHKGFYIRRNLETEVIQPYPFENGEQPGALYNPNTNTYNHPDSPVAFVIEKGSDPMYGNSELRLVSPDIRTTYSPLLTNGNVSTKYLRLDDNYSFAGSYNEQMATNLEDAKSSQFVSRLGWNFLFESTNGVRGIIAIKKVDFPNAYKRKVYFDIKYTRN